MGTISVILPNYNHAAYLERALRHLVAQYPAREIVILDDCSTDGSMAIIEGYCRGFPALIRCERYPQKSTDWLQEACRRLDQLQGDYVCMAAADDLLYHGFFSAVERVINRHPGVGAVFGNIHALDEAGRHIGGTVNGTYGHCDREQIVAQLARGTELVPGPYIRRATFESGCGAVVRRDVLLALNRFSPWELGSLYDGVCYPIAAAAHGAYYLDFFSAGNTNHPNQFSRRTQWPVERAVAFLAEPEVAALMGPLTASCFAAKLRDNFHHRALPPL